MVKCESYTEPTKPIEKTPYVTLKIGDIHQYKSNFSNTYFQWVVVDTTKRSDGLKVFSVEESIIMPGAIYRGINNYFLNEEYFIVTQLDTIDSLEVEFENPFLEHRIAKIFPNNGDYFQTNIGIPNSEAYYMSTNIIDSLVTDAKIFSNVVKYTGVYSDTTEEKWCSYYAQNFGHIGTVIGNQMGFDEVYATYCKSDTNEVGDYIQFIPNNISKLDKSKGVISYLFCKASDGNGLLKYIN